MGFELATCTKCGHIASHDYIKGRNQWYCESCHKVVKIEWREPQPTPMETETYEPIDGEDVEIDINEFQERLNHVQ